MPSVESRMPHSLDSSIRRPTFLSSGGDFSFLIISIVDCGRENSTEGTADFSYVTLSATNSGLNTTGNLSSLILTVTVSLRESTKGAGDFWSLSYGARTSPVRSYKEKENLAPL